MYSLFDTFSLSLSLSLSSSLYDHCRLQMRHGAVLFPTMYDMLVAMLESWKHGCFLMIGLVAGEEGEGEEGEEEGEEGEKRL